MINFILQIFLCSYSLSKLNVSEQHGVRRVDNMTLPKREFMFDSCN